MKSIKILAVLLYVVVLPNYAQGYIDALKISEDNYAGTARNIGMAGSFGALGGDLSAISKNPAGLGIYRSSEFVVTPRLNYKTTESLNSEDYNFNFNLSNIGFVGTFKSAGIFENISWSLGYVQSNNYNANTLAEVFNPQSSIVQEFTFYANEQVARGEDLNSFYEQLFFDAYLMDFDEDSNEFFNVYDDNGVLPDKVEKSFTETGKKGEFSAALGFNYEHKFYFGGGFSIVSHTYKRTSSHREFNDGASPLVPDGYLLIYPQSMNFKTNLYQYGTGFNFNVGVIVRPLDFIRVGASFQTPTFYQNMNEEYSTSVESAFFDGEELFASSDIQLTEYRFRTPSRLMGSIALQLQKLAVINIDYERVDYSKGRLNAADYTYSEENNGIESTLQASNILRAGAELNFNPVFVRGGYSLLTNPMASSDGFDIYKSSISGGIGFRVEDVFFDLAARRTIYEDDLLFQDEPSEQITGNLNHTLMEFVATIGFKF